MRTSKSFSTISYNTSDHLSLKLGELVKRGILDFWAYIEHFPEDDETKKHKHLYCVPSKLYDTTQLSEYLAELDTSDPLKRPLSCIACKSSKFGDWYQYACHDKAYLLSKGQVRKRAYDLKDFKTSDSDYFADLRQCIDYSRLRGSQRLVESAEAGRPFSELVRQGEIPIQLILQYSKAYEYISQAITHRAGRQGHERPDYIDEDGIDTRKP